MVRERWLADGYDLMSGMVRDVSGYDGINASPVITATDVSVPMRDGELDSPGRLGSGGFTLNFWMGAETPEALLLEWEQLLRKLTKRHRLVHWVHHRRDGTARECFGRVVGRINPTPMGQLGFKAQIEVTVPSGKWQMTQDADTDFMPFVAGGSTARPEGWHDPAPGQVLREDQVPEFGPYRSKLLSYAGPEDMNVLSDAASGFEDGTTGGWSVANATLSNDTTWAARGSRSLRIVPSGASNDSYAYRYITVAAGVKFTAHAVGHVGLNIQGAQHARARRLVIFCYNGSTLLGTSAESTALPNTGGATEQLSASLTTPTSTTRVQVRLYHGGDADSGVVQYDTVLAYTGDPGEATYENGWVFHPTEHIFEQTIMQAGVVDRLIELPGFAGASAPMTTLRYEFTGPITGLKVTCPETGEWLAYDLPLLAGESLYVNSRDDYVTAPVVDAFRYRGPYMMEVIPPDDPNEKPRLRIQASNAGLAARMRVRGRRQYLI